MSGSSDGRDPLDRLVEDFLERYRAGRRPSVSEYAARLPGREDEVRDLFPALLELEQLKPATPEGTADHAPTPPAPAHPERVGEYRILRLIGWGGMGAVYEAVQESLGRHVALKLLPAESLIYPERLERFRREARSAARLHHTNIVPVFGVGEADGRHFYAMQYIDGHPLDAVIDEVRRLKDQSAPRMERAVSEVAASLLTGQFAPAADDGTATITGPASDSSGHPSAPSPPDSGAALSGRLTDGGPHYWATVARLGAQAADALAYAHAQGILHRDIKPSNLLLDLRGTVWVTDFGLAKASDADDLTAQGDIIGTLRYLAPERFERAGDHRADLYALGLTLYELLTLEPAFKADRRAKLVEQVMAAQPARPRWINPAIPRDLETIVLKAIRRDPAERYSSAADLGEDLRRYIEDRPIRARRTTAGEQAVRWCRRNPAVAALTATVMLAVLVGAGVAWAYAVRADRERVRAVVGELAANSAREQAERAAIEADRARRAASDSAEEARKRLVRLYVLGGDRDRDTGDTAAALLWFHRAWERDRADPAADAAHRTRIAGAIDELPEMLGACFHDARVGDAAFSPDGRRVLTRIDGDRAFIWDYERSRTVAPPLVHAGPIRHITYSPDGKAVATASADGTGCVWDAETGSKRSTLKHDGPLTWIAFHPDGRRIATAAEDRTVRLWSAADGRPIEWALPVAAVVEHLAFSPDGSRILIAGRDKTARVWTVDPPKPISPPLPYEPPNATDRYRYNQDTWPRFAPDGRGVVSPDGKRVAYWPGGATDAVRAFPYPLGLVVVEVSFVPRSDRILVTAVGQAAVVGLKDGQVIHRLMTPRNANLGAVSPDGRWLLTCSSGGLVHLWDAATGQPAGAAQRCGDFCSGVAFSPDGSRYLAASQDGTVRVWTTGPRRTRYRPFRHESSGRTNIWTFSESDRPGSQFAYSPDGRHRVEWTRAGEARYQAGPDARPRPIPHPGPVEWVVFCDDGSRLVVSGGGIVRAWDAVTLTPAGPEVAAPTDSPRRLDSGHTRLSRDGARMIAWDDPRTVSVWDLTSGRRVFGPARHPDPGPLIFESPDRAGWVSVAVLSPDGRRLAVAIESSGTLTAWDVETGRILHHSKRFRGYIAHLRFSDDGRRIPVVTTDGVARLFDAATGDPLGPGIRLDHNWCGGDSSPDAGRQALIDRSARSIRLIDLVRGERLLDVPCLVDEKVPCAVSFDSSGRSLVASYPEMFELPLPRYDLPLADSAALVRFLTGEQIDEDDGIAYVDQFTFLKDPDRYRDVFQAWEASRGGGE